MHLNSFSVSGFRSLTEVADIPVRQPTILAGHNDGGKSALLDALAFLLGKHALTEDDRTYLSVGGDDESAPVRCEESSVEGAFTLDAWEQEQFDLQVWGRTWHADHFPGPLLAPPARPLALPL